MGGYQFVLLEKVLSGPFIVPLGAFLVAIVAIVSSAVSKAHARHTRAAQRMAMLQRGMTIEQIDQVLQPESAEEAEDLPRPGTPCAASAMRAGLGSFSPRSASASSCLALLLALIVREREVLAVAACGLIPLAIGIGFFVDYHLQKRELARFGLEVAADLPPNTRP